MAAEAGGDLSKAEKRELKWQRKQDKLKAAAAAAGETYVAPSKKDSTPTVEEMGKRKKRKLAALEQAEQPISSGTVAEAAAPSTEPAVLGMASQPEGQGTDAQTKADKKAAKKAKKAVACDPPASIPMTNGTAATTAAAVADANAGDQPKKKKTKKSAALETATPEQPVEAEAAPTKKVKNAKTGLTGKITVRQEAVLASVGKHCRCHQLHDHRWYTRLCLKHYPARAAGALHNIKVLPV